MVSRMGGAEWLCPFVVIVYFYSNNENSRSRERNGPAIANVRVLNVQRKENFTVGDADLGRADSSSQSSNKKMLRPQRMSYNFRGRGRGRAWPGPECRTSW